MQVHTALCRAIIWRWTDNFFYKKLEFEIWAGSLNLPVIGKNIYIGHDIKHWNSVIDYF
jgi:hypothetical protein